MGQKTSSAKKDDMVQPRDYIFSEDRTSILKRTKTCDYEIAASFPEALPQDFGIVDPDEEENYLSAQEKDISSTDPSFLGEFPLFTDRTYPFQI